MNQNIRLGVSSCLLGNQVRYNGGHQLDSFIVHTLGRFVEFVPVCPEVECGLGVPREPMRLVGSRENPRLVTRKSGIDHTERMKAWAQGRVRELEGENICGFICKGRSPSSGMERVRIHRPDGKGYAGTGPGIFAAIFMAHFPLLPVEEDGRLHDLGLRENFIERIFVYKRWRDLISGDWRRGDLVDFHTDHKLQLMAHSIPHYRALGALVAQAKSLARHELRASYERGLMQALRLPATVKKHTNVLHHMMGYFKKVLSVDEKQELLGVIESYHQGYYPLIVPVTLLNHYVRKHGETYLARQHYLNPHPLDLKLRNHA